MLYDIIKVFFVGFFLIAHVVVSNANQSVSVRGGVAEVCEVNAIGGASTATLDMSNVVSNQLVATLFLKCNDPNGFDLTLTSANTCALGHDNGNPVFDIAYTASFGPLIGVPTATNCTAPSNTYVQSIFSSNFASGEHYPLNVRLVSAAIAAGNYTDIITITIIGKF